MIEGLIRIHKHLDIAISGIDENMEKQQNSHFLESGKKWKGMFLFQMCNSSIEKAERVNWSKCKIKTY